MLARHAWEAGRRIMRDAEPLLALGNEDGVRAARHVLADGWHTVAALRPAAITRDDVERIDGVLGMLSTNIGRLDERLARHAARRAHVTALPDPEPAVLHDSEPAVPPDPEPAVLAEPAPALEAVLAAYVPPPIDDIGRGAHRSRRHRRPRDRSLLMAVRQWPSWAKFAAPSLVALLAYTALELTEPAGSPARQQAATVGQAPAPTSVAPESRSPSTVVPAAPATETPTTTEPTEPGITPTTARRVPVRSSAAVIASRGATTTTAPAPRAEPSGPPLVPAPDAQSPAPEPPAPEPQPDPEPEPDPNCTAGYEPCIPPGDDVDCAGGGGDGPRFIEGPVLVTGNDPYALDDDGNGFGCEP